MASYPAYVNPQQSATRSSTALAFGVYGPDGGMLLRRWWSSGHARVFARVHASGASSSVASDADASGVAVPSAAAILDHDAAAVPPDTAAAATRPIATGRRRKARAGTTRPNTAATPGLTPDSPALGGVKLDADYDPLGSAAAEHHLTLGLADVPPDPTEGLGPAATAAAAAADVGQPAPPTRASRRPRRTAVAQLDEDRREESMVSATAYTTFRAAAASPDTAAGSVVVPQRRRSRACGGSQAAAATALEGLPPLPVPNSSSGAESAGGDHSGGGGDGEGGGGMGPESLSAARARVLQVKASLVRSMRSARTTPSPDTMKLILTPVETGKPIMAAEPLRAGRGRGGAAAGDERAATAAERRREAAEAGSTLQPGERRRRLEQRRRQGHDPRRLDEHRRVLEMQRSQQEEALRRDPMHRGGWGRSEMPEGGGLAPSTAQVHRRVLKPQAARRPVLAADAEAAECRALAAGAGAGTMAVAAAAGAGMAAAAAAAEASEVAAVAPAEQVRRDQVQRANEEFAKYIEGVAAAAAAEEAKPGRRATEGAAAGLQQQQQQQHEVEEEQVEEEEEGQQPAARSSTQSGGSEPEEQQEQRVAPGLGRQSPLQQQQRQEQASLLRGLAQMFYNFAKQAVPDTSAAAVLAAFSPAAAATAVAAAESRADVATAGTTYGNGGDRDGGGGGPQPARFLGSGGANDVQLTRRLLTGRKVPEAEAGGGGREGAHYAADGDASDGGDNAAQARQSDPSAPPPPTRADLLRLLRPMARARLPQLTRSKGLRITPQQRPRLLRLPAAAPQGALELVGDGAQMSSGALRGLRRRVYFFRQMASQRQQQQQQQQQQLGAEAATAADQTQPPWSSQEAGRAGTDGQGTSGQERGEAATAAAAAVPGRPYSLSGRTFKVQRRAQYSDTLKRVVRRASLARGVAATGGAAVAAMAVAVADDGGAVARGEPESRSFDEGDDGPRGEYNPAAEVVNDMYEQIMGVRLPERAMYGKRAAALAAMTPSVVKEQSRSWIEACGRDYALAFHAREPLLLTAPASSLLLSLEHLSHVLGLPPEQCVQLALRNPAFVGLPYEQLQGAVEAVSEALEVGLQEAGKIVIKCPGLALRQMEFPVARRLELLGVLLPVSRDKLRQVVRQRPQLLTKSTQSLASFMMNASSALGLPLFDVSLMIAGCPGITGVSATRLVSRWDQLRRAAVALPQWRAQLATLSPPSLGRCLVANEAALERLQVVVDGDLAGDPELSSFKKVLTMSAARFETLTRARAGRGGAAVAALDGGEGHGAGAFTAAKTAGPGAARAVKAQLVAAAVSGLR